MKSTNKKFSVLIPEAENINLLTFVVNCLSQNKNVSIYVICYSKFSEFRKTNKVELFIDFPKYLSEEEWMYNIDNVVQKHNIDLILPVDELGIETAIKQKSLLKNPDKLVFLPNLENYVLANDKGLLAKHLSEFKIPTPKSFLIKPGNSLDINLNINFPVLAKPALGTGGGKGIINFTSPEELLEYFKKHEFECDYLIEEYIEGQDLGCNILSKNGKLIAYTMQKGTLWSNKPFSPQIGLEFFYNEELFNHIEKLMKSLDWNGVANVDIRYDINSKQFLILEINPRFWETTEASEIAGVNFPYLYCLSSLNIDFQEPKYNPVKFLNLLGLKETIKFNKFFIIEFKFILNNTPIKYYLKDPMPFMYIIYYKIKKMIFK